MDIRQIFHFIFNFGAGAFMVLTSSSLIYLIIKSKKLYFLLGWLIPVVLLLIFYKLIMNWAGAQRNAPSVGIAIIIGSLLACVIVILGVWVIGLAWSSAIKDLVKTIIFIVNNGVQKPGLLISGLLIPLVPLLGLAYVVLSYPKYADDPIPVEYKTVNINKSSIDFRKDYAIDYYGLFWWRTVKSGILDKPQRLSAGGQKLLFLPGFENDQTYRTEFHPNQSVGKGLLGETAVFRKGSHQIQLEPNSEAEFYPNGAPAKGELAEDIKWQVQKLGVNLLLRSGKRIAFYPNGGLKSFPLTDELVVNYNGYSLPLSKAENSFQDTKLFSDGSLRECYLKEDTRLMIGEYPLTFKAGEGLTFYEDGSIRGGTLAEAGTVSLGEKTVTVYQDMELKLYPGGKLKMLLYYDGILVFTETGTLFYQSHWGDQRFRPEQKPLTDASTVMGLRLWNDDCRRLLSANRIEIDPDFIEPEMLVLFDYGDRSSNTVKRILFIDPITLQIKNKVVHCRPFRWLKISD